eukprot:8098933-Pyramimonas_sp.AAC.1
MSSSFVDCYLLVNGFSPSHHRACPWGGQGVSPETAAQRLVLSLASARNCADRGRLVFDARLSSSCRERANDRRRGHRPGPS